MFCSNCGREVLEKSKFCLNCGNKLENIMEEKETKILNLNKPIEHKSIFNDNTVEKKEEIDKKEETNKKEEINKNIDLNLIVRNLCAIFITRLLPHDYLRYVYLNEETNKQYAKNIKTNFKKFDGLEDVLFIFNTSILEVGRTGMVFTKTKIYIQNNNEDGNVILIKGVIKVQYGKEHISINGIKLNTIPAPITKALADAVINIVDNIKRKY